MFLDLLEECHGVFPLTGAAERADGGVYADEGRHDLFAGHVFDQLEGRGAFARVVASADDGVVDGGLDGVALIAHALEDVETDLVLLGGGALVNHGNVASLGSLVGASVPVHAFDDVESLLGMAIGGDTGDDDFVGVVVDLVLLDGFQKGEGLPPGVGGGDSIAKASVVVAQVMGTVGRLRLLDRLRVATFGGGVTVELLRCAIVGIVASQELFLELAHSGTDRGAFRSGDGRGRRSQLGVRTGRADATSGGATVIIQDRGGVRSGLRVGGLGRRERGDLGCTKTKLCFEIASKY